MARVQDMTTGNPTRLILGFALPMLLGNLFQQLYSMVDTIVVGRFVGVNALAAVGATGSIDWMVLGSVIGLTQGFTILVAQSFGAEDYVGLRRAFTMAVYLSAMIAIAITVASFFFTMPLLRLLNTPSDIIDGSRTYIGTIFCGMTVIVFYNLFASVLRAMGDSRTPLVAMIIASLLNIVLDLLFVIVFDMGVLGVAVATVTAQVFSCLYCLWELRRLPLLRVEKSDWVWAPKTLRKLLRLGVPMLLANGITAAGGVVLQLVVNGYGSIFVAGFTTAHKIFGLIEQVGMSLGNAMSTYSGQNKGAGNYGRIREGVRKCCAMTVSAAALLSVVILIFGRSIISAIVTEAQVEVIQIAYQYLSIMVVCLFMLYLLFLYRSTLQGMGDTFTPMLSGFLELVARIGCAFLLPVFMGYTGVFLAEVMAWVFAIALLIPTYYVRIHRLCPKAVPAPEATPE